MRQVVVDIETNAVEIRDINRIHVVSYQFVDEDEVKSITDPERMKKFFQQGYKIIGHNFIRYDAPAIDKILDVNIDYTNIIDTLGVSWYLLPKNMRHGLAQHGERLGISKVKVEDDQWEQGNMELMISRCEEDVKINMALWKEQKKYLDELYDNVDEDIYRVVDYLGFKCYQIRIQEEQGVYLSREKCEENLVYLDEVIQDKTVALELALPPVPIIKKRCRPKVYYKKDGSLSKKALDWISFCESKGISDDYQGEVEYVDGTIPPSATSNDQIKKWLFSLGWKPRLFKEGANGKVPQIRDDDKNLCGSVLELIKIDPAVEYLEGLSTALHRRSTYIKAFLDGMDENGWVKASASGFTKTLRLKHMKPMVNLVKPHKPYGDLVRSCIIAPEGHVLVGSDVSSLEDKMKQIHIYSYDSEYVDNMNKPGWDAHLFLGEMSGLMTKEECSFHRWYNGGKEGPPPDDKYLRYSDSQLEQEFIRVNDKRAICKTATYALTYGCGVPKLMESTKLPNKGAQSVYDGYWKINKSVKDFSADRKIKLIRDQKWVWNETARMYGFLSADKDIFSSCNSMGGVKVFDTWLYFIIQSGLKPIMTFHDELGLYCKPEEVDQVKKILKGCMERVNKAFEFPVEIEIDIKVGLSYDKVH